MSDEKDSNTTTDKNSKLYDKTIPAILVFLSIVMVGLIIFAVGIITGWIAF